MDFWKKQQRNYTPLIIYGTPVERVSNTFSNLKVVYITERFALHTKTS